MKKAVQFIFCSLVAVFCFSSVAADKEQILLFAKMLEANNHKTLKGEVLNFVKNEIIPGKAIVELKFPKLIKIKHTSRVYDQDFSLFPESAKIIIHQRKPKILDSTHTFSELFQSKNWSQNHLAFLSALEAVGVIKIKLRFAKGFHLVDIILSNAKLPIKKIESIFDKNLGLQELKVYFSNGDVSQFNPS